MPKANSPLVKIQDVPDVPTIGTATAGVEEALVAFTPAVTGGRAYQYRALSTPDGIEAVGSASPILVPGLTGGTSYTFQVRGESNTGASTGYSSASNAVVPEELVTSSFDLLETQVLTSSAASVTFSSLSTYAADYQHLQLRIVSKNVGSTGYGGGFIRFNSDTGANYSSHLLRGNGSAVSSGASINATSMAMLLVRDSSADVYQPAVFDVLDPFDTSKNTTIRGLLGVPSTSGTFIELMSGSFRNTAALTSITFLPEGGLNLGSGSRFSLYGIRG